MKESIYIGKDILTELWRRLKSAQEHKEKELEEITDIFSDPFLLARQYVQPACQHHNPADFDEDEPVSQVTSPIFNVINRFFNREFKQTADGRNIMIVLADAGMGKTSLLVMIKLAHLTKFWPSPMNCVMHKIGPDTIDFMTAQKSKSNTILLLDALDEDRKAWGNAEKRLTQILNQGKRFRRVVITCRTQFFPDQDKDPFHRPGRVVVSGYICPMIYLSLFDDEKVVEFLRRTFPSDEVNYESEHKFQRAYELVMSMESLRFRPFLLANIEELLEVDREEWTEFAVYETLVGVWLLREERKIRSQNPSSRITSQSLKSGCVSIALWMQMTGTRSVSREQLEFLVECDRDLQHIHSLNFGGRSLLNRNSDGAFRFSHYSVQEFIVAEAIINGFSLKRSVVPSKLTEGPDLVLRSHGIRVTAKIIDFILVSQNQCAGNRKGRQLHGITFDYCDLSENPFVEFEFLDCEFRECYFENTGLESCSFTRCRFVRTNLNDLGVREAKFQQCEFEHCSLTSVKFVNSSFESVKFRSVQLLSCNWEKGNWGKVSITGGRFNNVGFSYSEMRSISANDVQIGEVKSERTSFVDVSFVGSKASKLQLLNCDLDSVRLVETKFGEIQARGVFMENSNFNGTRLEKVNIQDCCVRHATVADGGGVRIVAKNVSFEVLKILEFLFSSGEFVDCDFISSSVEFELVKEREISFIRGSGDSSFFKGFSSSQVLLDKIASVVANLEESGRSERSHLGLFEFLFRGKKVKYPKEYRYWRERTKEADLRNRCDKITRPKKVRDWV